jgi:ComF family protein
VICTECLITIPRTNYHLTADNPAAQLFWGRCQIEKAAAFSYYTKGSRIRKIIHKLKYDGMKEAGFQMGKIYASALKESGFFEDIDLIIPVPLHPSKRRKRGFNQCDCICSGISEISSIPVDDKSLARVSVSDTQTKKTRYDRWLNVEGIFEVKTDGLLTGKHILLVDDVITTGSTIESCTNALLKVEGVKVSVIALAVAVQ